MKSKKKRAARGRNGKRVQLIPSTSEAARDEGPRLIPLDDHTKEASRFEHYLDLADAALGLDRGPKAK